MPALIDDHVADRVEFTFIVDSGCLQSLATLVQSYVLGCFNIGLTGNHPDSTVTDGKRFVILSWHIK
jgi:hypothetical protein